MSGTIEQSDAEALQDLLSQAYDAGARDMRQRIDRSDTFIFCLGIGIGIALTLFVGGLVVWWTA